METNDSKPRLSRRKFIQRGAAVAVGSLLAACADEAAPETVVRQEVATATRPQAAVEPADPPAVLEATEASTNIPQLEPTPACDDGDDETPAQTEGPFYTPDTPERQSLLEADSLGTKLIVTGRVMTVDCQPLAGAMLDFWHADDAGEYDNEGYRFRGHQFADANGAYRLETIVPGLYPGRTRHIHVRVQGRDTALLTTQMYFPDELTNRTDGLFNAVLVMDVVDTAEGQQATFDFVL